MKDLKIKKAMSQDIPVIVRIHRACVKVINAKYYPKSVILAWLKQVSANNVKSQLRNSKWIVLRLNDKIVGFAQYSIEDKTLYQINILPKYSGKGFGKIVYAYIENEFLKNKIKTVVLNATLNAVPFYKKLRFKRIKNISFKLGSTKMKIAKMKKYLRV